MIMVGLGHPTLGVGGIDYVKQCQTNPGKVTIDIDTEVLRIARDSAENIDIYY